MQTAEHLLTPHQTADLLGVKLSTVRTWASRRQIPVQRVNAALRFSPSALREWLAAQARPVASPDPFGRDVSRTATRPTSPRLTCARCGRILLRTDRVRGECGPGRGCGADDGGGHDDAA